ncbi:MAG: tRNA pseudouridine(38-40) synthase TruA [Victivallales bacterium]|jgi:tRNA pseudouridine38-40 synthase|nr:tRNA pseudouridine(38-40) synthase TruA [Victivallales bacterium]
MNSIEHTSYQPYKRYLLEIAYDGSNYSGWQIQPHCIAVQEILQKILTKMYAGQNIHLIGSSRTDAGVHAQRFAASYLTPTRPDIPPDKILRAVNRQLPSDIKIRTVCEVPLGFHARYDALGKAYTYVLNLGALSPFVDRYSWSPYHRMDVEKIRAAAQVLTGTHDYSSFVVERSMIDEAVRTIYRIDVQEFGQFCCCTFVGNGFLYKMIRCLIGTFEAAGAGKLTPEAVKRILEARDRTCAPETAPPQGLFLMKVFYSEVERADFRLDGLPFVF